VDLLVNGVLLIELKTVKALDDAHMPPGGLTRGSDAMHQLSESDQSATLPAA
jgi:hypothetical protein